MVESISEVENAYRRRNVLRGILLVIIIGTLPFYCLGFFLWGTAPQAEQVTVTPEPSLTPIGGDATVTASPTPTQIVTTTPLPPLAPTSGQFFPPPATRFLSATPFFPTNTLAPTLTFPPPPTLTPAPTDVPPPSSTPVPPPSDTPVPIVPTTEPTAEILLPTAEPTADGGGG